MANCAIVHNNLADATTAVLSASGANALTPVSNLKNGHVARIWSVNTTTATIDVDFGSATAWDTLMLAGMNLTATGTTRVTAGTTLGAADVYDSTTAAGRVTVNYGQLVILRPNSNAARFVRITMTDASLLRIEAGRLFIGLRSTPEVNFAPGFSRGAVNGSQRNIGIYGQTFIDRRPGYFVIEATFQWLSVAEKDGFVEQINLAIINTGHLDLLFILDTASTNLERDSLLGYIDGEHAVTEPAVASPRLYASTYRIRQRL